jgi:hypothetical protein
MTGLEHSLLATGLLAIFYYVGVHVGKKEKIERWAHRHQQQP